jgi:hypothetical protein
MLAEVSDKIAPAGFYWVVHGVAALAVGIIALYAARRSLALVTVAAGAWAAFFVWLAAGDDPLLPLVVEELGWGHVAQQVLAAVLPLAAVPVTGIASRHAVAHGSFRTALCPFCGYDLRATPDRCPECGTIRA